MNKRKRILGQILLAVGLTLTAGGIASFFFSNVELRFLGQKVFTQNARVLWIIVNSLIALSGLLLLHSSRKN